MRPTDVISVFSPGLNANCPPVDIIAAEARRDAHGHFNLLHIESGARADVYLAGRSPLARRGHLRDVRAMLRVLGDSVDAERLKADAETLGLAAQWREMERLAE